MTFKFPGLDVLRVSLNVGQISFRVAPNQRCHMMKNDKYLMTLFSIISSSVCPQYFRKFQNQRQLWGLVRVAFDLLSALTVADFDVRSSRAHAADHSKIVKFHRIVSRHLVKFVRFPMIQVMIVGIQLIGSIKVNIGNHTTSSFDASQLDNSTLNIWWDSGGELLVSKCRQLQERLSSDLYSSDQS